MSGQARTTVPVAMVRLERDWKDPLPLSAELGRATTCELKPPHVIAFEYLPEG
jgi:hypothetical protein